MMQRFAYGVTARTAMSACGAATSMCPPRAAHMNRGLATVALPQPPQVRTVDVKTTHGIVEIPNKFGWANKASADAIMDSRPDWLQYPGWSTRWHRRAFVGNDCWDWARLDAWSDSALRDAGFYDVRQRALHALACCDAGAFETAGLQCLEVLAALPPSHPLSVSPHLTFFESPAPNHALLRACLRMCFMRAALAAGTHKVDSSRSGFAMCGDKGTGKTMLLQTVCLISSLLLPNFVTVYMDATEAGGPNWPTDIHDMMSQALRELNHPLQWQRGLDPMLKAARGYGLAMGVFVDEARHLFERQPPVEWNRLHTVLQDFTSCCFVADSTTVLPAYVRDITSELDKLGVPPNSTTYQRGRSLNGDKMLNRSVQRFHHKRQYEAYLRHTGMTASDELIYGLHIHSGGRLRSMQSFLGHEAEEDEERVGQAEAHFKLPPASHPCATLLWNLWQVDAKRGGAFDPFRLPTVGEAQMIRWLDKAWCDTEFAPTNLLSELNSYVEAGWLSKSGESAAQTVYGFASPRQCLHLHRWTPPWFVSHA